ncbi:hypothetical protein EMPS_00078 [Entomortierella parvispora]|uniref:F-box domain-containing protein n=1 Tax=Entomortierella parvispora TaxID=205924 RepID=A0A9P3LRH5_9FUNG|nr:hypothetical protein EMPS_00078 [Entomortierella parvispora]
MDRYGQHIRSLHLSTENFRRVALFRWPSNRCRNLQELAVHVYWDEDDLLDDGSHEELYIKDLVMRNPSISRLTVNGNHAPLFKVFDWNAILFRNGLALKELSLYSVFLNLRSLCTIYDFSRRLFKLELVDCQCEKVALDFSEFFTSDPQFPNLIELTIVDFDDNIIDLEEWIHHCPKLHSLKWSEDMWRLDFENWAQAPIWSNLQSINLRTTTYRHYYRPLTDSQVSYILDGCAPLKKFSVDSVHLWIRFYNSLERHFATVEHIEIPPTTSYSIPQWIWQRILTSCPRLTYLMAGELNACFLGNNHAARARRERERLLVEKRNNDRIRQEAGHRFESRSYDLRHWTAFKKDMENVRPWVCRKLESLYLSIGEIILNFGKHLIRRDLTSCIRVCKLWHQALAPLIYDTVQDLGHGSRPSFQAVERYGQHIRSLHLSMEDFRRVTLYRGSFRSNRCRNLQELTLHVNKEDEDPNQEWYIVDLVKRNPGLFRLAIIGHYMLKYSRCIWSSILLEHGLALRELSLRNVLIFKETRSAIYALSPRLCKLELIDCEVDYEIFCDRSTLTSDPQFPNLTELSIDDVYCDMELDDWLSHCPKLHTLNWICSEEELGDHDARHVTVEEFEFWAEKPIWSNLHSIDLRCVQQLGVLTDTSVSMILENCAPLRKLTIDSHHLWVRFYTALERHFETLEHIEVPLRSNNSLPQWMWQGILISCPRLICLIAGGLNACLLDDNPTAKRGRVRERRRENRIIDDRIMDERRRPDLEPRPYNLDCWYDFEQEMDGVDPWVCQKLETLSLGIGGMPKLFALGRWDDKVFERISELGTQGLGCRDHP